MRECGKLGYIGIKIMIPVAYDGILKATPAKLNVVCPQSSAVVAAVSYIPFSIEPLTMLNSRFALPSNEFLFALTFIEDESSKPIATILFAFQSRFENDWGLVNASAVMMLAPVVVLFMFFQKRFIAGLTSGASKG